MSVEDKLYGLPRIQHLLQAPAAVRFLSIEPLLEDLGDFDISGIDWAIVGGESGHGARRMQIAWVERILHLCKDQDAAFFFKQWGGVRKSTTGRSLHGKTYDDDICVHPLTEGAQPIRLTKNPADDDSPDFSLDGGLIAFHSNREGGGIYVVPTFGGEERLLVRNALFPRFSPDGKWIAYSTASTFLSQS